MRITRREFIARSSMGSLAIPLVKADMNGRDRNSAPRETFSILCLGSGAADWDVKEYPQKRDLLLSGTYRGQSSILINGSILVDCGETVPLALDIFEIDPGAITDIVITHTHGDHFNIDSIRKIATKGNRQHKPNLWVEHHAASYFTTLEKESGCTVRPVNCFEPFSIDGIEITPVEANHFRADTGEQCLHYIFSSAGKSLFYALDGGWLTIKTWNLLKKMRLDAIIWDATWGSDVYYCIFSHNGIPSIRMMKRQLFKDKVLTPESQIILTHLSRNCHPSHRNVEINMQTEQIITAFDGARFSV
jgi:phosphoribosyl 1,2-cyclic phosphate phosphodiesterase